MFDGHLFDARANLQEARAQPTPRPKCLPAVETIPLALGRRDLKRNDSRKIQAPPLVGMDDRANPLPLREPHVGEFELRGIGTPVTVSHRAAFAWHC